MEDNYPEIALKQPKADPRTVLLFKRNFMESSSDHIQDFYRNSIIKSITTTPTIKCDKLKNMCKCSKKISVTNTCKCASTKTAFASKISLESLSASSISSSSSPYLLPTTSSWSASLLSSTLVNFSKSCHFNASFINTYLYNTQKTKLVFFLLFIWCAIFLQTTEAELVHRVTTSGRQFILHTNVYRERYHQKLLEEQRQHNKYQQLIQQQLQAQQRNQQLQLQQEQQKLKTLSLTQSPTIHYQKQVQKNHIFPPSHTFRKYPQPLPYHRHHLHQRAAPATSPYHYLQQNKMSYCNGNKIYQNLHQQMNASMSYIKQLCANYLRDRGNETFEDMSETWKLLSLEATNPNRKQIFIENELHKKIHDFYLNLHSFDQLIDYASQDTNDNKTKIEHGEEISIDKIIKFLQSVKAEIKFNMKEAENLLEILEIEKPDLADNTVVFNSNIGRRIRDFLIIKNLIEEFERLLHLVPKYCENNESN